MAFDLEKAIKTWRKSLRYNSAFLEDDADELEAHLRDYIDDLIAAGNDSTEAFEKALGRLGERPFVEAEYRKTRWGPTKRERHIRKWYRGEVPIFWTHLLLTMRLLRRHSGYTFLNITGFAISMASCILIFLFVRDELSYDRFHVNADRIYRVVRGDPVTGRLGTPHPLVPTLRREFPEVENTTRVSTRYSEVLVRSDLDPYYSSRFYFVDSTFFDIFTFPLISGDPETALVRPFTMVVNEETARKHFGEDDPVGKTITIKGSWDPEEYEITGVAKNAPHNSHFKFDFLASYTTRASVEPSPETLESWFHAGDHAYVLMKSGHEPAELEDKLKNVYSRYSGREIKEGITLFSFQPLTRIHLHSHLERELELNSDAQYIYIFSIVALFILLIACINYMNLATARAFRRANEVGVRKVAGARRSQLVLQFYSEAIVLGITAVLLAIVLAIVLLPHFGVLTGKDFAFRNVSGWLLGGCLGIGILVGLLAGSYPALFLSRFLPVKVLRGTVRIGKANKRLRHGLVVFQFAMSVILIVGTIIVQRQLDYLQNTRLGLDPEQVIVLSVRDALGYNPKTFKDELLKHTNILSVTISGHSFPTPPTSTILPEGFDEHGILATDISVDQDFLETLDIRLLHGENIPEYERNRDFIPVLVNETAVAKFGWEEPIGKKFVAPWYPIPRVVGVVEDFHFRSFRDEIEPLMILATPNARFVMARVRSDDMPETIAYIQDTWKAFAPGRPFEYSFLDDRFDQLYRAEERLGKVFGYFSILAILIACLGLFGLAAFTTDQRTREIGIRKVLGASTRNIIVMLSRGYVRLLAVACLISLPVAYVAMSRWLEDFAYRTDINGWIFLVAGAVALVVMSGAVGYHSVKAALTNPASAIRHE